MIAELSGAGAGNVVRDRRQSGRPIGCVPGRARILEGEYMSWDESICSGGPTRREIIKSI